MRFEVAAILFDIDGTLLDSTPAVERTWRSWSARNGVDAEAVLRVCHGRRSEDTIADFLPEDRRAAAVAQLESMELSDLADVVALPAVAALLDAIPSDRWAAVTSGSRRLMRARLAAAGLPEPTVLIAGDDVRRGKPDPEGYLAAAAALGAAIEDCLVIEDAPAGVDAGRAAGARVLGVGTSHPRDELTRADVIVDDLRSLRLVSSQDGLIVDVDESRPSV